MTYLQWRRDTRERVSVRLRVVRAEMGGVVTEVLLWQVTNNLDHQVQIRSLGIRANLARRDASPVVHQFHVLPPHSQLHFWGRALSWRGLRAYTDRFVFPWLRLGNGEMIKGRTLIIPPGDADIPDPDAPAVIDDIVEPDDHELNPGPWPPPRQFRR